MCTDKLKRRKDGQKLLVEIPGGNHHMGFVVDAILIYAHVINMNT